MGIKPKKPGKAAETSAKTGDTEREAKRETKGLIPNRNESRQTKGLQSNRNASRAVR
ncbi:MAG TPA: hypothetical protein VHC63_18195 [Acidimicrobiales bacterium]|nr:hypothetical protein [Acidimicrobiales bacterium]